MENQTGMTRGIEVVEIGVADLYSATELPGYEYSLGPWQIRHRRRGNVSGSHLGQAHGVTDCPRHEVITYCKRFQPSITFSTQTGIFRNIAAVPGEDTVVAQEVLYFGLAMNVCTELETTKE